ncbi:MAG: transporter substrate-binding domain-containing protein [Coriobacteriales bacterium]|jgi:polar amino acid transport system substrate-binding protein|nr:transporter substrate-binding domain-containing protein [Coriobacteriales bacterium]
MKRIFGKRISQKNISQKSISQKRMNPVVSALLIGILVGSQLLLGGCFAENSGEALTLGSPKVAPPAIATEGVLRVGVDSSHAPFAVLSDDDVLTGIDIDIAAALADDLGLRLELVDMIGQDASTLLSEGSIDVIMDIRADDLTAPVAAQVGPYLVDGPAIFTVGLSNTAGSFDLATLNGMRVSAYEGSLSAWQIGELYGEDWVDTYPTLNEAFDALNSGTVSYAAADAVIGSFLAVTYDNIDCVALLTDPSGIYMGVGISNLELLDTLQGSLRAIRDNGVLGVITNMWLGPVSASVVSSNQAIVSLDPGTSGADIGADLPDPSNAG